MTNSKPVTGSYFILPQYLGDSWTKDRKVSVAAKKNHETFFFFNAPQGIAVFHVLRDFLGSYCLIKKSLEKYFNSPWRREKCIISLAEFSTWFDSRMAT